MKSLLWLVLGAAACVVSWTYMHRVLMPWEHYVNVTRGRVKVQMGDLYPRWVGTRELLLNGRNPYSPEVSHEIQMAFYGHPIVQSYDKPDSEILDEQRFAYPVYVVFLLAPVAHVDFARLQEWAPLVLGALIALSVWLWMGVLQWRPSPVFVGAVVLFVLSSPQVAQGMRLRQFGLLVAFLLALASWCVVRQRYLVAGILLAISTIKPQMVPLCLLWFLIWTLGDWKKRWPLAAGFGVVLAALIGAGEWLLPGWPRDFIEGVIAYRKYFHPLSTSPLRLILGDWMGGALSVLAVAALLGYSWNRRRLAADSREFAHTLGLFLVASTLVLPLLVPDNHVLIVLPVLMLLREWSEFPRWGRAAFALLVAWPLVTFAVMLMHPPQLDSMHRTPLLPSLLLLLFPFLMLWTLFARRPHGSLLPTEPQP